ncbi:hypothetical protein [Streptomyces lichenis]|uniref:Nucleopolyhedrovirus P10 family protein n=1 Tax=Streptomyces lichenis TaxID=2306967 RepID=A0ABT0ICB9_9ACTN|nr:hypothetical protein [Streptomyces lichenis]MCK8678979.1 hypothetical protein [Streptomyces lichenis]
MSTGAGRETAEGEAGEDAGVGSEGGRTGGGGWTASLRGALAPGLLLPLGDLADGAWIAERAAAEVLGEAMGRAAPDAAPGRVRVRSAAGSPAAEPAAEPVAPEPPGALPRGPLRVEAEFAAVAGTVLPEVAERLRTALFAAADELLGLRVDAVDLRVTALLDAPPERPPAEAEGAPEAETGAAGAEVGSPEAVAAAVPGVARLTGAFGRPVHRTADQLRVELATAAGRRALDVARAVRGALRAVAEEDGPPVVVVVTGTR